METHSLTRVLGLYISASSAGVLLCAIDSTGERIEQTLLWSGDTQAASPYEHRKLIIPWQLKF